MTTTAIAYLRVSTAEQGRSGLGLEAQAAAALRFIASSGWKLAGEYVEVASGRIDERPVLEDAIAECRRTGAVLVVAKLDRLSRRLSFVAKLLESDIRIVSVDLGKEADLLTVQIMAVMAETEARKISERTSAALQALKARGVKLGNPNPGPSLKRANASRTAKADAFAASLGPVLDEIRSKTHVHTYEQLADCLNRLGYKTRRGGVFYAASIRLVEKRWEAIKEARQGTCEAA
jgi:DNA invertase Pin-like site-specific DNA recombinase